MRRTKMVTIGAVDEYGTYRAMASSSNDDDNNKDVSKNGAGSFFPPRLRRNISSSFFFIKKIKMIPAANVGHFANSRVVADCRGLLNRLAHAPLPSSPPYGGPLQPGPKYWFIFRLYHALSNNAHPIIRYALW